MVHEGVIGDTAVTAVKPALCGTRKDLQDDMCEHEGANLEPDVESSTRNGTSR